MPTMVGVMADSYNKPAAGFSPLSIPWHSAFWASDPSWIPPADGAAVSDWKNSGTAAANATQGSAPAQPTYRAAYTNLNGKPVVDFDGTGDYMDAITPSIVQPNHVFAVAWLDPTHAANPTLCDGVSSTSRHLLRNNGTAGTGFMNAGTSVTLAGGGATGSFAVAALYNQVASKYRLNGTAFTPSTVGTQSYQSVRIGASAGAAAAFYKGAIAFLGVSDTELTAQQITDLETWAKNYYGVTIAGAAPPAAVEHATGTIAASRTVSVTFAAAPLTDDVVLFVAGVGATGGTITVPSGWVNPLGGNVRPSTLSHGGFVVYHRVTAAEAGAATVTYTATNIFDAVQTGEVAAYVIRNVNIATPVDAVTTQGGGITAAMIPAIAGADLSTGSFVVAAMTSDAGKTRTAPAGWTLSTTTVIRPALLSYNTLTTAGTDVATIEVVATEGFDEWSATTIAFTAK